MRSACCAASRGSTMQGLFVLVVLLLLLLGLLLERSGGAEWCYQSQVTCESHCKGPEKWHEVGKDCKNSNQSPINIVTKRTLPDERLTPFRFTHYQNNFNGNIKNNGHTVQVNLNHGPLISHGGLETTYKAMQFHLHWGTGGGLGSEHTVDGERYPMELHIVHIKEKYDALHTALKDPTGVAVLGFFYQESTASNKKYDPIINALKMIAKPGNSTALNHISLASLILPDRNMTRYYRYKGSLTTPNCTESVVWTVFEDAIPLSKEQLDAFSKLKFSDGTAMVNTFRPVQPLNRRMVYRSRSCAVVASAALLASSLLVFVGLSRPN